MTIRECILILLFLPLITFAQRQWSWEGGSTSTNTGRIYGILGLPAPTNNPGSRIGAAHWTDADGNLWVYGGRENTGNTNDELLSDLWMYNVSTHLWTWIGGDRDRQSRGRVDQPGIFTPGDHPGARRNAVFWTLANGDFYLFGGWGMPLRVDDDDDDDDDDDLSPGMLNDLWRYSTATRRWTLVSGSTRLNEEGNYGNRGDPSTSYYPGGRYSASGWVDAQNRLWLFGGRGFTEDDDIAILADVWVYSPADNTWTWMNGSATGNDNRNYGQQGQFDPSNSPGARHGCMSWTDNNGNFWLYGGGTLSDLYADLWRYDHRNNAWSWISGTTAPNSTPLFQERGVPEVNAHPGSRTLSPVWVDEENNVWLFGGNGYGDGGSTPLNNLWRYSIDTNEWTFLKGDNGTNPQAVYGNRGEADSLNTPGGTSSAAFWQDNENNFWFYGGRSRTGYLNQVWKLSAACSPPTGSISPATASICEGGSQILTASGGTSYEWSRDGEIIAGEMGATITATMPGTYSVVISANGCSAPASNTAVITAGGTPTGGITPAAASICEGGELTLTATGGTTYSWKLNGVEIAGETDDTIVISSPGTYSVTIDNNGCTAEGSNTAVVTEDSVIGKRYPDVVVAPGTPAQLSAGAEGTAYVWSPATGLNDATSPNPTAVVNGDTEYTVRITGGEGCDIVDTVLVRVSEIETDKVAVPSAFTPDGNNVNDLLRPLSPLLRMSFFRVYNRWGNKVFETNKPGEGWNGKLNGVDQPSDTYLWILSATLPSGETVNVRGKSLLIR